MVNFRYHIISLTAVFLALGIGLAMGAAFIDRATVDTLNNTLTQLRNQRDGLRNEIAELQRQMDLNEQLAADGGLQLLAGHLTDVPVVIVAVRGVDESPLEATREAVVAAGAAFGGTLWLTDRNVLDDEEERAELGEALGVEDIDADDLHRTLANRLGNVLASAAERPDEVPVDNSPPVTPEPELLSDLRAAGFIDFDAPPVVANGFEVLPATGARYVVVSGPGAVVPDDQLLLPMVDQMAAGAAEPAVLAADASGGSSDEEPQSTFVAGIRDRDDLRDEVTTVDNIDSFAGRAAVVLALAHFAAGQVGHYGLGDGADELVPPAVEGG